MGLPHQDYNREFGIIPAKAMLKYLLQYCSILAVQFFEQTGDFSDLQAILQSQGQK